MLTSEQLGTLKQVNISMDSDKTSARAEQLWKSQSNAKKKELVEFAGCIPATVHRIYKNGKIHIKLAIAFAQVLNVNPYYLTGEADEPGEFTEAILLQLLNQHGYNKLTEEIAPPASAEEAPKPKRKYTRKQKPEIEEAAPEPEVEAEPKPEVVPEPEPEIIAEPEPVFEPAPAPKVDIDISEEDMQALLHSLVILDRAGVAAAQEKLAAVKGILVS